jgi:hypothetical protein
MNDIKLSNITSSPLWISLLGIVILVVTSCVRILWSRGRRKTLLRGNQANNLALDPFEFRPFKLIEKTEVTYNVRLFRFATSDPQQQSLVHVELGKHVYAKAWINGKEVRRPYNPINKPNQKGYLDILVKVSDLIFLMCFI